MDEEVPTTLEHLAECLANIPASEDVALLGDMNARTGSLNDILSPWDFSDPSFNPEEQSNAIMSEIPGRNNSDHTINSFGKPFIELIQTSGLIILNGRTLGDIFGAPTCIQRNGVSTVDYICTSPSLFQQVRYFEVRGLCQYSDHKPLSMALTINSTTWSLEKILEAFSVKHLQHPYRTNGLGTRILIRILLPYTRLHKTAILLKRLPPN